MSKQNTRATIDANIKQNGQQLITGAILNSVLNTMVTDYAEQEKLTDLERKVGDYAYKVDGVIVNGVYGDSRRFFAIPIPFERGKSYRISYSESNNVVTLLRIAKRANLESADVIDGWGTNATEYSVDYVCKSDEARYLVVVAASSVTYLSANVVVIDKSSLAESLASVKAYSEEQASSLSQKISGLSYLKKYDKSIYETTNGWELTISGASKNDNTCVVKYRCTPEDGSIFISTKNQGLIKFVSGVGSVVAPSTGNPVATPFTGLLAVPANTTFLYIGQSIGDENATVYPADYLPDLVKQNKQEIERLKEGTSILPSYYDKYIAERTDKITKGIASFGEHSDAFVFLTDLHVASNHKMSPMIIETLLTSLPCRKCICGGDICNISSSGLTKDDIWNALISYNKLWYKRVSPYGTYYNIRGNHDAYVQKSDLSYVCLDNAETHNVLMKRDEMNRAVFDNANPIGNYYYFDNEQQKIRYIVIDSTDTIYNNKPNFTISENQREFILKSSKDAPSGYGIVYLTHIPFVTTDGVATFSTYTITLNIIEAVANHLRYNDDYDFSSSNTKVIAVIAGHTHTDEQNYKNGVLHITTACDAAYSDYIKSPLFETKTPPAKTSGTIYEQTLDVYSVSPSKVQSYRIGGGFDRRFNLEKNIVAVGGHITLTSLLEGSLTWMSYDSYSCSVNNGTWTYANNKAEVSNGVVTGKTAGDSVIVAMDANGNKEFFYVSVQ